MSGPPATSCGCTSLLMNVTRSPTLTVISGGLSPALLILTVGGSDGDGVGLGVVGDVALLEDEPQEQAKTVSAMVTKAERGFRPE